jgi:catalase
MKANANSKHYATRLISLLIGLAANASVVAAAPEKHESPAQLVDALHSAFGVHHARAVHAKGIILEGNFTPSNDAKNLSKASLFSGGQIPVTIRFSDFTGIPDIPDNIGDANPRGFAVKFKLADGATADIVTHSFNGFPTKTADEFAQLLRAIGTSGPTATKPTPIEKFLDSHPIAKTFLSTQKPAPVSYATLAYFGVNSFKFTDASNKSVFVRYRFVPKAGEQFLEPAAVKAKGPNYLVDEIATRVIAKPVVFDWFAQISHQGDAIADPSIAWPESRKLVKLGTIRIVQMAPDQASTNKATMFLPGNVPAGIEAADPMIALRNAAYPISFSTRQ